MDVEQINSRSAAIIDAAMTVHSALGPGLLESAYQTCLAHELRNRGFAVATQVAAPIMYKNLRLDAGYRIDILVDDEVIVELKSVASLLPIHDAQLLSYLRLADRRVGLLINFNVLHLKDGIKRLVNGLR
jgi:GxxExxY protein